MGWSGSSDPENPQKKLIHLEINLIFAGLSPGLASEQGTLQQKKKTQKVQAQIENIQSEERASTVTYL